jgi:hypothetical protein
MMVTLLLIGVLMLEFNIQLAKAEAINAADPGDTIHIQRNILRTCSCEQNDYLNRREKKGNNH